MIEAGTKGYIFKNSKLKDLHEAIRTVYNGNTYNDKNMIRMLSLSATGDLLRYALEKKYDF